MNLGDKYFILKIIVVLIVPFFLCCCGNDKRKEKFSSGIIINSNSVITGTVSFFNIIDFGAVTDGKTKNTEAFKKAIAKVKEVGGGTVYVPPGEYLTGPIHFVDNMTLFIEAGALVKFSTDFDDYYPMVQVRFQGIDLKNFSPLIYAYKVNNISIKGKGTIDGQGKVWNDFFRGFFEEFKKTGSMTINKWQEATWKANAPAAPEHGGFMRPQLLLAYDCKNVTLEDVSIYDSPFWTTHFVLCQYVNVNGIFIKNPPSMNPDGINPESCKNVHISNCHIDTDDDCITIKAGKNKEARWEGNSCENITITNCTMTGGAAAIGIGSEMSGGVRNVTVSNCVFKGTSAGIYIKTIRGRGGVVEDVMVNNLVIKNVKGPAIGIDAMYWVKTDREPVTERTPVFRNFTFSNIRGSNNGKSIAIRGLEEMLVENINISNVDFSDKEGARFEFVKNIRVDNVTISPESGPAFLCRVAENIELNGINSHSDFEQAPFISIEDAENVHIKNLFMPFDVGATLELSGSKTSKIYLDEMAKKYFSGSVRYKDGAGVESIVE